MSRIIFVLWAVFILVGVYANAAESMLIKADGSSTVYPIMEAMAEEFQTLKKDTVKITAGISGTGGGFKKFCRGETDIQDASRPITTAEMEDCKKAGIKYFELPIAYDATVVAVNTKNTWLNEISVADLKKIWEPSAQGKVMKWNQINPAWPDNEFKLYGAGSDSGTFDYFTEAIVGKAKSSRGDYTASEDDNTIIKGIAGDKFAIGYVPMSYYMENKKTLKVLAILAGKLKPKATLKQVARLCRWLEAAHGISRVWPSGPPKPAVAGGDPGGHNRSAANWTTKGGHYGHCHVPENIHWDPAYTAMEAEFMLAAEFSASGTITNSIEPKVKALLDRPAAMGMAAFSPQVMADHGDVGER